MGKKSGAKHITSVLNVKPSADLEKAVAEELASKASQEDERRLRQLVEEKFKGDEDVKKNN